MDVYIENKMEKKNIQTGLKVNYNDDQTYNNKKFPKYCQIMYIKER